MFIVGHAATNTDVVVLGIKFLSNFDDCSLWVYFGNGKHKRYIALHEIVKGIGRPRSSGLPFVHTFTGCGTVPGLCGIGKKTAWSAWYSYPEITPIFIELSSFVQQLTPAILSFLERFVVVLYKRTSPITNENAYFLLETDKFIISHRLQLP